MPESEFPQDPMPSKLDVWIGLIEVYPEEGCELLTPQAGAVANVLGLATDLSTFNKSVTELCRSYHLELWSLEDAEPIQHRLQVSEVDSEIERLIAQVRKNRRPVFSTLHTFPIDDGKKPH